MEPFLKSLAWEEIKLFSISLSCSQQKKRGVNCWGVVRETDQATQVGKGRGSRGETTFVRTTNHLIPRYSSLQRGQISDDAILRKSVPTPWDPWLQDE